MNIPLIDQVIEDLNQHQALLGRAIDGLSAMKELYGPGGAIQPKAALPPPAPPARQLSGKIGRLKPGKKPKTQSATPSVPSCAKHPDAHFTPKGKCRKCASEYQAAWQAKKNGKAPALRSEVAEMPSAKTNPPSEDKLSRLADRNRPAVIPPVRRAAPDKFGDELEYSKPVKCPKCGALNVRFSRPEEFNRDTDSWTCLKSGCQVRIAHIVLAIDRGYEPDLEETA